MNQPTARPLKQDRPKTASRLPQCNKSNRLMRRFYSGRTIPPVGIARPVWAIGNTEMQS